eukprot:NODE_101_length_19951_cov_0.932501.p17 type:complete len:130 gc:universal NODE_101_length_19951_cov_0.932501:17433-17822(+)
MGFHDVIFSKSRHLILSNIFSQVNLVKSRMSGSMFSLYLREFESNSILALLAMFIMLANIKDRLKSFSIECSRSKVPNSNLLRVSKDFEKTNFWSLQALDASSIAKLLSFLENLKWCTVRKFENSALLS